VTTRSGHGASATLPGLLGALAADPALWQDYLDLCRLGGRQAGSASEASALEWVTARLAAIDAAGVGIEYSPYATWRCREAHLDIAGESRAAEFTALLGTAFTAPGGLDAEALDLGRGTPEAFEQHAAEIAGRVVLVRHEYPFASGHIHRRRKIGWAMERGAAGLLIANPAPGAGPVSGSSGRDGGTGIPALGIDGASAALIGAAGTAGVRVRMEIAGEDVAGEAPIAILDLPGREDSWVVLSAHLDGHALGESALDNATGVAAVLAIARAFAPQAKRLRRGLRVCLFSAEEWALAGSRAWLDRMREADRARIALNVNLDTVAGDGYLTALTSGFTHLEPFVAAAAASVGLPLGIHRPMMSNSDHYNFARHGIPALRLVAGFDRPHSNVRHILTRADTRDKAAPGELKSGAIVAATIVAAALTAETEVLERLRGL